MPSRRALAALLALLIALIAAAVVRAPSAGSVTRDQLMKTSLLALQCAIEKNGAERMYVYPHPKSVSPAGGLPSDFWPRDPWTGRRLTPGTARGHYIYVRAKDYRSYQLTGYLSGGRTFVVTGGMAHTPMLAYDHRGKEGLNLIFQYVKMWSRSHDGRLPTASMVRREGSVGRQRRGLLGRATRGTTGRWSSAPTGAPSATCVLPTARRSPSTSIRPSRRTTSCRGRQRGRPRETDPEVERGRRPTPKPLPLGRPPRSRSSEPRSLRRVVLLGDVLRDLLADGEGVRPAGAGRVLEVACARRCSPSASLPTTD